MTNFWKTWLKVWCWGVILFGLVLAGGGLAATDGAARFLLTMMNPDAPTTWDATHRFAIALMGAVTLGWGATLLPSFAAAHRLDDPGDIWRGLTLGMLVWFVIDSSLSVATGFWLNAVSNTALLIGYLIPLLVSGVLGRSR